MALAPGIRRDAVDYVRDAPQISLEGARAVVDAVLAETARRGLELSVAVVDAGGHLVAFARTDGAELQTVKVAERKARSAAFTHMPTGPVSRSGNTGSTHHLLAITLAAGAENFVTVQGGVPIRSDDRIVGGVAVSGAAHADGEIAAVGAAVLAA
ncbi:GlcG/HbpS family heme-binding protein [Isoptericola aurantiacus]|uniref:GlcG/HbpS family heme-binding protein n=1 Tax=Isoptericola aurantiacus TaxID=3377839 RepID=UPI00383B02E9